MKPLTQLCDASIRVYPAAAVIRPRSGGRPFMFRSLRPENGHLEIRFTTVLPGMICYKLSRRLSWQQDMIREIQLNSIKPSATRTKRSRTKKPAWQAFNLVNLEPARALFRGPGVATRRAKVYRKSGR